MSQQIDYLGAVQSTFDVADSFNQRLKTRIRITQLNWAFHLDKASKAHKPGELNLATSATSKENLIHIEFSVDDQEFSGQPIGIPIPRFTTALENALSTCLKAFESSHSNADGWNLTTNQVVIAFVLDNRNQFKFIQLPQDAKNDVTQKLTFSIKAR